jgi:hypothetical protein
MMCKLATNSFCDCFLHLLITAEKKMMRRSEILMGILSAKVGSKIKIQ